ncbi:hypothetical protein N7492_000467 [Penicillium capsulatum]|uniref:NAD(P)-binding domain-containing protein n=1 Tax=Penicillium capsulatum TaxID=69766 RepID=A0A9W9IVY8_9EURO|nr:hypothetical protein N7492_000467 [Penicillium capsulatum]KAJ6130474.1 hypothetical protein N7512_003254 [Penicillium capsulatum]
MKVILTGSTGFIGREVLNQCLHHPAITSVVALSRRDLPAHDKLHVVIIDDFLVYPASAREIIKGADACIWTLGKARISDNETARRVSVDYTLAAAQMFQDVCPDSFRFVYCSGAAAEKDQTKSLWFMQDYRRLRGEVESALLEFARGSPGLEAYIMRPAMVLSREVSLHRLVFSLGPSVSVDTLAGKMVRLALDGGDKKMWENAEINEGQ